MNKYSVMTIRIFLFLTVIVTLYFYLPFAYHFFVKLNTIELHNSSGQFAAGRNLSLNRKHSYEVLSYLLQLVAFIVCFFALPGGFLFCIWHLSKRLKKDSSPPRKTRIGGRWKKDRTIAGFDGKLLLNAYNQLQHIEAAIDNKMTKIKEDIVTEMREELRNMVERKAEAEQCLGKARTLYKSGLYEEALGECNNAVELSPSGVAHYIRGVIHHKLSQDEAAINDLKTAAKFGYQTAQDFLTAKGISYH